MLSLQKSTSDRIGLSYDFSFLSIASDDSSQISGLTISGVIDLRVVSES